ILIITSSSNLGNACSRILFGVRRRAATNVQPGTRWPSCENFAWIGIVDLAAVDSHAKVCVSRGALAQLVRAPPCHGGGCGFEPRRLRGFCITRKYFGVPLCAAATSFS